MKEEPKHPTEVRLDDQIGWYGRESRAAQRRYKALKLAQMIIAGLIPLASVSSARAQVSSAPGFVGDGN